MLDRKYGKQSFLEAAYDAFDRRTLEAPEVQFYEGKMFRMFKHAVRKLGTVNASAADVVKLFMDFEPGEVKEAGNERMLPEGAIVFSHSPFFPGVELILHRSGRLTVDVMGSAFSSEVGCEAGEALQALYGYVLSELWRGGGLENRRKVLKEVKRRLKNSRF